MKKIILAALALPLLAACQTPSQEGAQLGIRVDDARAPTARVIYDQVAILDKTLQSAKAGKLAIESQGARRTATGTLNVIVQVRNRTDFPQVIEARTSFFDGGFAPTENPSGWNRLHLPPNGIATYQESSMGAANVAHYYVEIREAR
jgi:allantoicase